MRQFIAMSFLLLVKFTVPDPRWTFCQLIIGTTPVGANLLPAKPCPTDPTNVCATVPLTLGPGVYPFQLLCTTGDVKLSNGVRTFVSVSP